jgi:hypothetical protein
LYIAKAKKIYKKIHQLPLGRTQDSAEQTSSASASSVSLAAFLTFNFLGLRLIGLMSSSSPSSFRFPYRNNLISKCLLKITSLDILTTAKALTKINRGSFVSNLGETQRIDNN